MRVWSSILQFGAELLLNDTEYQDKPLSITVLDSEKVSSYARILETAWPLLSRKLVHELSPATAGSPGSFLHRPSLLTLLD